MTTNTHPAGTHADALAALRRAGHRAQLENTGGGCMAYAVTLEGGRYVLVTSVVDVLGRELSADDEGWSAGVYCSRCGDDHDALDVHAQASTQASTTDALTDTVRRVILAESRTR